VHNWNLAERCGIIVLQVPGTTERALESYYEKEEERRNGAALEGSDPARNRTN